MKKSILIAFLLLGTIPVTASDVDQAVRFRSSQPVTLTNGTVDTPIWTANRLTAFGEQITAELVPRIAVSFPYGINSDTTRTTTVNGATVTWSNGMAEVAISSVAVSSATISSRRLLRYVPGQGAIILYTALFTPCVSGSTQTAGIGDDSDGLFFGCNGSSFGVLRRKSGVDTWTPQTAWNLDTMTDLDISKGNVYQIQYQWLGFGDIRFSIEDSRTGRWRDVHIIRYANANTNPSISNPSLPMYFKVLSSSTGTAVSIKTSSWGGFIEGNEPDFGVSRATATVLSGIGTTETTIATIRVDSTFLGQTNRTAIKDIGILVAADGASAGLCTFHAYLGTTVSTTSFSQVNPNSVVSYSISTATLTGSRLVSATVTEKSSNDRLILDPGFQVYPGETLTITGFTTTSTFSGSVVFVWREEL